MHRLLGVGLKVVSKGCLTLGVLCGCVGDFLGHSIVERGS